MRLIIHDLKEEDFKRLFPNLLNDVIIISNNGNIHHCTGCFGCWVKTPATCVIRDGYEDMGKHLSKCKQLIIISKCCYGGFSPFVKNVLDRSISYIHPYFVIRNGEMHHKRRYNNDIDLLVWFYGENITEKEKLTAQKLIKANSINLYCNVKKVTFSRSVEEIKELIF